MVHYGGQKGIHTNLDIILGQILMTQKLIYRGQNRLTKVFMKRGRRTYKSELGREKKTRRRHGTARTIHN